MFKHPVYKQTLKVGLVACIAATIMWVIYISGAGVPFSTFLSNAFYFPLVTIIPIALSSLLVAKVLLLLSLKYTSSAKAVTVGIISTLLMVLLTILILTIVIALLNLIFKGPEAFSAMDEIYALFYVILIGVVMGSWAIVPLGVWQGRFLRQLNK
jgi:hypothetical protein